MATVRIMVKDLEIGNRFTVRQYVHQILTIHPKLNLK